MHQCMCCFMFSPVVPNGVLCPLKGHHINLRDWEMIVGKSSATQMLLFKILDNFTPSSPQTETV
ncbi:hypothetical protein EXN66_Car010210 [Channa argus]|uniref:Uncharacterized protein n=1 Tax=Channa argus TaxID=215402 RepID=A0A6G1PWL9_CHAAH|nr:hypothetical protein EXN66_Car010210 [Channa argus]